MPLSGPPKWVMPNLGFHAHPALPHKVHQRVFKDLVDVILEELGGELDMTTVEKGALMCATKNDKPIAQQFQALIKTSFSGTVKLGLTMHPAKRNVELQAMGPRVYVQGLSQTERRVFRRIAMLVFPHGKTNDETDSETEWMIIEDTD